MNKLRNNEFLFEVFALIIIAIIVQGVYATVVRPQAAAIAAHDAAQMARDPDFVGSRSIYVIIKDYEQEICFVLALWSFAIMGYKGYTLRRGRTLLATDVLRLPDGMKILPEDSRDYARQVEALPASMRTAPSTSLAFMSFIFSAAMSRSCAIVTLPLGAPLPGVVVPFWMPAAFFRK